MWVPNDMNDDIWSLVLVLALVTVCVAATPSIYAQEGPSTDPIKQADRELSRLEQAVPTIRTTSESRLKDFIRDVTAVSNTAADCIKTANAEVTRVANDLAALGTEVAGEPAQVTNQRNSFGRAAASAEQRLASCRLLSLRSEKLLNTADKLQQTLFTQHLLERGPSLPEVITSSS